MKEYYKPGEGIQPKSGYALTLNFKGAGDKSTKKKVTLPFKPKNITILNIENLNKTEDKNGK